MDPAPASVTLPVKRNHKLRQHYESSPSQILSSLQTVLSVSLLGREADSPPGIISLTNQVAAMDLPGLVLTEPVSQQSVAVAARYLFRQADAGAGTVHNAVCHHDSDHLHPGQLGAEGVAPRPHPVSTALHCAVTTPHKRHVPAGPAAGAHRSSAWARRYFPLCSTRWSSNASRRPPAPSWSAQPQVLVSAAVSVQTDGRED